MAKAVTKVAKKTERQEDKKEIAKAEPEVETPPLPPMPKPERREHEKMVDLYNDKDVEAPPDAKYLAQKNNRAEVETRARDTNLDPTTDILLGQLGHSGTLAAGGSYSNSLDFQVPRGISGLARCSFDIPQRPQPADHLSLLLGLELDLGRRAGDG